MSTQKRNYEKRARAEAERRTRDRIVAATVSLHEEVGPARTTIAEIARRAGVQRLTVYNAFPDPAHLFAACQERFLAGAPPPDLSPRWGRTPPDELEAALQRLYAWYRVTAVMTGNVQRDRRLLPALDRLLAATVDVHFRQVSDAYARALTSGRSLAPVRALISLALHFHSWEVLDAEGLSDAAMAQLMALAVRTGASSALPPT